MIEALVVLGVISICLGPVAYLYSLFKNEQLSTLNSALYVQADLEYKTKKIQELEQRIVELEYNITAQAEMDKRLKETELQTNELFAKVTL